ncbi:MAG TPA: zinc-binding dehydrogenase [Bryobacteraceae bacterium]|jgi:NADPH:quinone reductase-like Zn-dependent oxidoreductase|nr:zinc-binding dehydrogenase [Bryobacteraceae bacterium]
MRQIWITRVGGPEVLEVREAPDPTPGPGELRIRVRAAGINFADTMARIGLYPDAPKLPFVPGYEVAGIVDRVGPGVDAGRIGQKVVALTRFKGYADTVCALSAATARMPENIGFAQAAAVPVVWLTAWHMLVNLGNLRKGQRVLIHGAAGGVGTAALQICRHLGAEVLGTASPAKHARLKAMGIDHTIDSRLQDVEAETLRFTNGKGVDIVLDPVGGKSFKKSFRSLAPTGKLMVFGASSMSTGLGRNLFAAVRTLIAMPIFLPVPLMNQNRGVLGINMGRLWGEVDLLGGYFVEILNLVEQGVFQPIVDLEVPFAQAGKGHQRLAARENFGKVVIVV